MMRVSVIIPVYNGAATIARAIDSALGQDFDGYEVIVVNDGSTDDTGRILESYGTRIQIVNQRNRGLPAARNAGVKPSRGEYLAFLDDDDIWLPDKLSKTCTALDENPEAALSFSDSRFVDERGNEILVTSIGRAPTLSEMLSGLWPILPSTVVMRRSVFDRCDGFEERLRWLEDTFMWLRVREEAEFVYVAEPLVIYRQADLVTKTEKYEPGRLELRRLLRERYGSRVTGLIASLDTFYSAAQIQKAIKQIDSGDSKGALRSLLRAGKARPSYFVESHILRRVARPLNARRLLRMFIGSPMNDGNRI